MALSASALRRAAPRLTFGRWLLLATALCAFAALRLAPDRAVEPSPPPFLATPIRRDAIFADASEAGAEMQRLHDRVGALELRDSLLAVGRARDSSGLTVRLDPALPADFTRAADSLVRERWNALGPAPHAPVLVAFVLDTGARGARGVGGAVTPGSASDAAQALAARQTRLLQARTRASRAMLTFLPHATDGRTCLVLVRLHRLPGQRSGASVDESVIPAAPLGPCALYARFGAPGPGVRAWLDGAAWRWATHVDWAAATASGTSRGAAWRERPETLWEDGGAAMVFETRRRMSLDAVACRAGDRARCLRDVTLGGSRHDSVWRSGVVTRAHPWRDRTRFGALATPWLLSDMVRDLGPERFAAFWRSERPVTAAFAGAAGRPLEDWVHAWAVGVYGAEARGPALAGAPAMRAVVLTLVIVGLAAGFARRRVVG